MVRIEKLDNFYNTMSSWFEGHDFPILDKEFLSDSIMVYYNEENKPCYSVCMYLTNSKLCWFAFPLSNPFLTKEEKIGGIDSLINVFVECAKELGFKYIFTTSSNKSIEDKLIKSNFSLGDSNVNHYLLKI